NRIAALVGAGPDRGLVIVRPIVDLSQSFGLPAQVSTELLGRRPDVIAAQLRADGARKRIDQARAAFYPSVNLSGFLGLLALGVGNLGSNGSSIGSAGPAVSLPIFDGGRLRGQLNTAEAEHAEAVASYDSTVVQALQEVADATASRKALGSQIGKTNE